MGMLPAQGTRLKMKPNGHHAGNRSVIEALVGGSAEEAESWQNLFFVFLDICEF